MAKLIPDKQLSIPGLPRSRPAEPKEKKPTQDDRIDELARRVLQLELEVSLLRILVEKGENYHA